MRTCLAASLWLAALVFINAAAQAPIHLAIVRFDGALAPFPFATRSR